MGKRVALNGRDNLNQSDVNSPHGEPQAAQAKKQPQSDTLPQVAHEKEQKVDIAPHTARNLYKVSSWFQIPLFFPPDDVIIDEVKVSVVHREFFLIEQIRTFLIKDIIDVVMDSNLLFGTLKVSIGEFKEEPIPESPDPTKPVKHPYMVQFLKISEAAKARRIIAGLKILAARKENTSEMTIEEIKAKAEELGRAR